jgi:hypothetical protein
MAMTTYRGRVQSVERGTDLSYAASASHGPIPIQNQLISFRIDGKPMFYRTRTLASFAEGDEAVAVGKVKNGTLEALALRNLSTGATYHAPYVLPAILAAVLVLLGVPLIGFLGIGLLFIGFGAWILWKVWNVHQAAQSLPSA